MPIRSWISAIMGQITPEHLELFAVEFAKIAEYDFVYTLASTNIDKSAADLVKIYVISDEFDYGSNQTRTVRVIYP